MKNTLIQYGAAAADLLLPRTCIVCGRKLGIHESHICLYCISDLPFTFFWHREHNPMADKFNEQIQKTLEAAPATQIPAEKYAFAAALYFFSQGSDYKNIQYSLKYKGNISAGRHFGRILGDRLASSVQFKDADTIIPVPLHWTRKWSRGYNQAEAIACGIALKLGAELRCDILARKKRTRTQTMLSTEEKARNVKEAFIVKEPCKNIGRIRHILVVDDIFTTGSTLHACFTALRRVFPADVRISIASLGYTG